MLKGLKQKLSRNTHSKLSRMGGKLLLVHRNFTSIILYINLISL